MHPEAIGCLAALGSAFFFSYAATLFQRLGRHLPPVTINLGKGLIALTFTGAALLVSSPPHLALHTHLMLGLSGLLGITIGDTAYFHALSRLGARRTLLFDTLGPGLTALTALLLLHESLSSAQWAGMLATLAGVGLVVRSDEPATSDAPASSGSGVAYALVSMACHTAGVMLAKKGLLDAPPLASSFLRQLWAVVALALVTLRSRSLGASVAPEQRGEVAKLLVTAAFFGTFLGIWLTQVALSKTSASLAVTLGSTGPLFALALSRLLHGEPVPARAWAGTAVAVLGVAVLLAQR